MRNSILVAELALLCVLSNRPGTAAAASGHVVVSCDAPCTLTVDGGASQPLPADEPKKLLLAAGEHIIIATAESNSEVRWRKVITVDPSAQVAVVAELARGLKRKQTIGEIEASLVVADQESRRRELLSLVVGKRLNLSVPARPPQSVERTASLVPAGTVAAPGLRLLVRDTERRVKNGALDRIERTILYDYDVGPLRVTDDGAGIAVTFPKGTATIFTSLGRWGYAIWMEDATGRGGKFTIETADLKPLPCSLKPDTSKLKLALHCEGGNFTYGALDHGFETGSDSTRATLPETSVFFIDGVPAVDYILPRDPKYIKHLAQFPELSRKP
jgi:hypothetical protein